MNFLKSSPPHLYSRNFTSLTFVTQKSGIARENFGHVRSGAIDACPVTALVELHILLRNIGDTRHYTLEIYCKTPQMTLCHMKSSDIYKSLKYYARFHISELRIRPDNISVSCLCSSGTMALLYGFINSSLICLLGWWKIWTALKRANLLVEANFFNHFRGIILCNVKCLQFHLNKKQEHSVTVQQVFYSPMLSFF